MLPRFLVLTTVPAVALASALPFLHSHIERLVVFGDSFSDNGTGAWLVSNRTWPADPAYFKHTFSNGPVWAQDLAASFKWTLEDHAVGGATSNNTLVQGYTGPGSTIPVPSALDQVTNYLNDHPTSAQISNSLFTILIGANDIFFSPNVNASDTVHSIQSIVTALRSKGATYFLIVTIPDLAALPYGGYISSADAAPLHEFSTSFRRQALALAHRSSEYTLTVVDVYSLFEDFFAQPKAYGFARNTTHSSCLTGVYSEAPRSLCTTPDEHVFWDEYHPTRRSHAYMARLAKQQLSPLYG